VWLYSVQGEVFALNNCLLAAVAYLTVVFYECEHNERVRVMSLVTPSSPTAAEDEDEAAKSTSKPATLPPFSPELLRLAYWGALACGLAMTNQHTSVFPVFCTVMGVLYSLVRARLINGNHSQS
jgi:hypothetical protein